jgi:hypothetical protein
MSRATLKHLSWAEPREKREKTNVNEYDAAIFFMTVMMNSLTPGAGDRKVANFVERHTSKAARLTQRDNLTGCRRLRPIEMRPAPNMD